MIDPQRPDNNPLRNTDRIVVIGATGSGKSTIAGKIAQTLDIPHIEFDAYRHGPNWTETPNDVFRERLRQALQGDTWVADGNYRITRDVVWPRATMLVWLDYPIRVVMWRLWWRTIRRTVYRQELWNGNRERVSGSTSSVVNRCSYGRCRLIGRVAGRYRQRWPSRSTPTWNWSTCARQRPHTSGSTRYRDHNSDVS